MGEATARKKMRSTILVLSLAIFYVTASVDDVVPEDNLFALTDDLSEAQQKINEMTAAGASEKECRELVKETRKDVTTNVNNCQKIVDSLPRGDDCPNHGQDLVKTATELKSKADKHVVFCHTEVTKAASASVDFGSRTFSSLTEGKCSSFYSSTSYTTAQATYKAAVTAHIQAKGAASEAATALKNAIAAAAKAKHECLCKTKSDHEKAFATHSAANGANQKAWNFACKVECVLDRKTSCTCSAAPMCKRAKLYSEVMEADCSVKKMCCKAMTAKCLACAKGKSVEEYCKENHFRAPGCMQHHPAFYKTYPAAPCPTGCGKPAHQSCMHAKCVSKKTKQVVADGECKGLPKPGLACNMCKATTACAPELIMTGQAKMSGGVITIPEGSSTAYTKKSYKRPLTVSVEMRMTDHRGEECGVAQIFGRNNGNGRHSGYSFGDGWWAKWYGWGANSAEGYRNFQGNQATSDGNIREWVPFKVDVNKDGTINFAARGKQYAQIKDTRYNSGPISLGHNCRKFEYKNLRVTEL